MATRTSPTVTDPDEWTALFLSVLATDDSSECAGSLEQLAVSLYAESHRVDLRNFLRDVRNEKGFLENDELLTSDGPDAREVLATLLRVTAFPDPLTCEVATHFVAIIQRTFKQLVIATTQRKFAQRQRPVAEVNRSSDGSCLAAGVVAVMSSWAYDICATLENVIFPLLHAGSERASTLQLPTAATADEEGRQGDTNLPSALAAGHPEQTDFVWALQVKCDACRTFVDTVAQLLEDLFTVTSLHDVEAVGVALYSTALCVLSTTRASLPADTEVIDDNAHDTEGATLVESTLRHCAAVVAHLVVGVVHQEQLMPLVTLLSRHWRATLIDQVGILGEEGIEDVCDGGLTSDAEALAVWQSREAALLRTTLFPSAKKTAKDTPHDVSTPIDFCTSSASVRMRVVGAALLLLRMTVSGGGMSQSAEPVPGSVFLHSSESLFWQIAAPLTAALEIDSVYVLGEATHFLCTLASSIGHGALRVDADQHATVVVFATAKQSGSQGYQTVFDLMKQLVTLASANAHPLVRKRSRRAVELLLRCMEEPLRVRVAGSLLVLCPFPSVARFLHTFLVAEWTAYNADVYPKIGPLKLYEERFPHVLAMAVESHVGNVEMAQMEFVDCLIAELNFLRVLLAKERARLGASRFRFSEQGRLLFGIAVPAKDTSTAEGVRSWVALFEWLQSTTISRIQTLLSHRPPSTGSTSPSFAPVHLSDIDAFSLSMAVDGVAAFL